MPTIVSPFVGSDESGGGSLGELFNIARGALGSLTTQGFFNQFNEPRALQGGGGRSQIAASAGELVACGAPTTPFRQAATSGVRAQNFIACNPVTGAPVWFGKKGTPLLWSDDLSACKRVARIAGKANRATGRRRTVRRGRR